MLLSWQVLRGDAVLASGEAVNEIVIKNSRPTTVLQLEAESGGIRCEKNRIPVAVRL